MVVLQACAFAAPAPGNFLSALMGLEEKLKLLGVDTIYAFPERARDKEWCKALQQRTKVYFLPEAQARIRMETYQCFWRIYRENDVQIVHSHFELYDIPATVTAPKGVKVFWHLHDALKENYERAPFVHRFLTRLQYGFFSKRAVMLSVSEEHARFAESLGFDPRRIHYVPNGINTQRIRIGEIDKYTDRPEFLLFGWEVHRKGVDLLVEAAGAIRDPRLRIRVVGQEACREFLTSASAPSSVVFSEPVSDINELYGKATAFLHISRAEGLSYALLEAIYAGLPIICSDIPENRFAERFRNILWIRSGSVDDLTGALVEMLDVSQNVRGEDIRYNQEQIMRYYSQNIWVDRITTFYMEQ